MDSRSEARRERARSEAFAFSGGDGLYGRGWSNVALLWAAPLRAWWAVAAEAMDPENYRR